MTLGYYLTGLTGKARQRCQVKDCNNELHLHSYEIYHREGSLQITIKPQFAMTSADTHNNMRLKNQGRNNLADQSSFLDEAQDMSFFGNSNKGSSIGSGLPNANLGQGARNGNSS